MRRALFALCLTIGACTAYIPRATLQHAEGDPQTLLQLQHGRELYVGKCSGCHSLFDVDELDDDAWHEGVSKMLRLDKLDLEDPERRDLLLYLTTLNIPRPQP